jgi:hypothetical protein
LCLFKKKTYTVKKKTVSDNPVKRHLIILLPKKRVFLGVGLLWIILLIFEFGTQNKIGAKPMFWDNYRPIPATSGHFMQFVKFKKPEISSIFGQIWHIFFSFQNAILGKIGHRTIANWS